MDGENSKLFSFIYVEISVDSLAYFFNDLFFIYPNIIFGVRLIVFIFKSYANMFLFVLDDLSISIFNFSLDWLFN